MAVSVIPMIIFTALWGVVGIVLPFFVPKGVNRGIIQTMLAMGAVCGYLFWFLAYMAQVNPMFGPQLNNEILYAVRSSWS